MRRCLAGLDLTKFNTLDSVSDFEIKTMGGKNKPTVKFD